MSDDTNRLQIAEERLDRVQDILDEVRRVLAAAEKAEAAAERARADLRKVNLVVLISAGVVAALVVVSRRQQ
jgi:chromosome segregation ATPase